MANRPFREVSEIREACPRNGVHNNAIFDTHVDDDVAPGPGIPGVGNSGCVGHGVHPGLSGVGPVELLLGMFDFGSVELHPGVVAEVGPGVGKVPEESAQSATTESQCL